MLKENVKQLLDQSGMTNKEIVSFLDEIRKDYHDRRNVGKTNLDAKPHSKAFNAVALGQETTLSKDKKYVFYKGSWHPINLWIDKSKYFRYLGKNIKITFRKKSQ